MNVCPFSSYFLLEIERNFKIFFFFVIWIGYRKRNLSSFYSHFPWAKVTLFFGENFLTDAVEYLMKKILGRTSVIKVSWLRKDLSNFFFVFCWILLHKIFTLIRGFTFLLVLFQFCFFCSQNLWIFSSVSRWFSLK